MQRSRTMGLLMTMATALVVAACKKADEPVAIKVFANVAACVAAGLPTASCAEAFNTAEAGYENAYPRYPTKLDCEDNAGPSLCEIDRPRAKHQFWRPVAIGFILTGKAGTAQAVVGNVASPSGRATANAVPVPGKSADSQLLASLAARPPSTSEVAAAHPLAVADKPATVAAGKSDPKADADKKTAAAPAKEGGKKHWGQ